MTVNVDVDVDVEVDVDNLTYSVHFTPLQYIRLRSTHLIYIVRQIICSKWASNFRNSTMSK